MYAMAYSVHRLHKGEFSNNSLMNLNIEQIFAKIANSVIMQANDRRMFKEMSLN